MLNMAFQAGVGKGPIKLSAPWGDLIADGVANSDVTLTFGGGSRLLRINIVGNSLSGLEQSKNGGAYLALADEGTISVSPGDMLNFRHVGVGSDTVQIFDQTFPSVVLDSFDVAIS